MNLLIGKTIKHCIIFMICFLVFFISPLISAQELYADITIDITESGFVTIEGDTNHPSLLAVDDQSLTSKISDNWYFEISKDEVFSEIIYKVILPPGAEIFNIDSSGTVWIGDESNRLIVYGLGQNETLSLEINYQLSKTTFFD